MGREIRVGAKTLFENIVQEEFFQSNSDISDVDTSLESFKAIANGEFERVQHLIDKERYWDNINSAVRLFGGIIQDNGNGTVRVGAGGGIYKVEAGSVEGVPAGECEPMGLNSAQGGKLFYSTWNAKPVVELTNHAYNYIFIVWDHTKDNGDGTFGGTQIVAATNFYMQDWEQDPSYKAFRDDVIANPQNYPENYIDRVPKGRSAMLHAHTVGRVYKMDNEIIIRVCGTNGWNFNKRIQLFGEEFFPVIRARGLDISTVQNTLKFNVTEGVMWAEMANRFTVREFNMENGDKFTAWYKHQAEELAESLNTIQTITYPNGKVATSHAMEDNVATAVAKYNYDTTNGWVQFADSSDNILDFLTGTGIAAGSRIKIDGATYIVDTVDTDVNDYVILRDFTGLVEDTLTAGTIEYKTSADIDELYSIIYSTVDEKYYRVIEIVDHVKEWNVGTGSLSGGVLTVNNSTAKRTISTELDVVYELNLNCATFGGTSTVNVGTTDGGNDLGTVTISGTGDFSVGFIGTGDTVYIEITTAVASDTIIDALDLTEVKYGQIRPLYNNMLINDNATWAEVLDYVASKIYTESKQDLAYLDDHYPTGYHNNIDGIDYVLLQLQATDAFYEYDGARTLGDRWVISSKDPVDNIVVAFIGDVELMNTTYPAGYNEIINIIVPTDDGKYFEYSGVEGISGWNRVHGYVERSGWLRFYNQEEVDPNRFNDTSNNRLSDIPVGEYGVAWIYMVHDNKCHVVYGQQTYSTKDFANQAALPSPLPGMLGAYSTLVGKMTFSQGGTAFENAESPFLEKFVSSAVSLHNDLGGLDGGSSQQNKYYHLNEVQYNNVSDLVGNTEERLVASENAIVENSSDIIFKNTITETSELEAGRLRFSLDSLTIEAGTVYTITDGSFHKVINPSNIDL